MAGKARSSLLLGLLLLGAAAGGGYWWWQQHPDRGGPGAAGVTAASAASGASSAASAATAPASGASGAGAGGRRFGAGSRVQPVTVGVVRVQDIRVVLPAIGNISALNTAVVRPRVDGELRAIRFKEGDNVRAGTLLAEIDPRSFEVALAQAQAQLARDQAQLRNAQLDLQRYRDLLAKDSIARQQVDTQDALVNQLQGTVKADEASVDSARLQLSYTKVTAPISGRLGLKTAELGSIVRASDASGLVTITQTQPIHVVFGIPEAQLPAIHRKLRARDTLTVEAWDREMRQRLATGKVSTTDNSIDAATGTIKVKAEFANADGALYPNQFINIRLQIDTQENVTAVPNAAVQRGAIGTFVYVVKEDSTVTVRRVRLGVADGDWVGVQGELEAGERVVTDGADRLREGSKVDVVTPPPRPGEAGRRRPPSGAAPGGPAPGASGAAPAAAAPASRPKASGDAPKTGAIQRDVTPADGSNQSKASAGPTPGPAAASGARLDAAPGTRSGTGGGAGGADPPIPQAWLDGTARPPWLDRLPADAQERFLKGTPDERRVFIERLRERRRQMQSSGG